MSKRVGVLLIGVVFLEGTLLEEKLLNKELYLKINIDDLCILYY